jgi:type IV pilus assembly protein PilW
MHSNNRGFTLVELMVALALGLVTALATLNMLSTYLGSERRLTARNDAQINAALALAALQRELRMAGAGLTTPLGRLCASGVNIHFGNTLSDGSALHGLRIIDGGSGPDRIDVLRSQSDNAGAPLTILQEMASAADAITVDSRFGLNSGDLLLVGSADGLKTCTLTQLTSEPEADGNSWRLLRTSSSSFNPATPASAFTNPMIYGPQDVIVSLGPQGPWRFDIVCNDFGLPSASNRCDLVGYPIYAIPSPLDIESVESYASQVVDLQAQYGIAPVGSATVSDWIDATGSWESPSVTDERRIRAVRIAIVARDAEPGAAGTTPQIRYWTNVDGSQQTRTLTGEASRYRYHVLSAVIPLINVAWSPL